MWVHRRFIDDVGASKQLDKWLAWLEFTDHTQTMQAREICFKALGLVYTGLAADIELQKKYDWAKYYHNQGDIKLVFTGPAGRLVLDFLEPITPDAACWVGGRTYRADMPQPQPAGFVFEWQTFGNLERCELFGGALVLEVAPAVLPGAWAARANYMSLGDWTSPGAAKKCLQDWLLEKMKGFNGQAAKLKMLKWDDSNWKDTGKLTCQPLPGLMLVIMGMGVPTYNLDVYSLNPETGAQITIERGLPAVINAKSAAQRWWRERIESLYE